MKIYGFDISQRWQQSNTIELEVSDGLDIQPNGVTRAAVVQAYQYNGLQSYTVRGEDTLQQIALTQLGNDNLWPNIAAVNENITSNSDLVPGEILYIPVQTNVNNTSRKEQFILTEDIASDPYGTDIQIDATGNLIIQEEGDFSTVSGVSNIEQMINLRLQTQIGSMIKQTAFGLIQSLGLSGFDLAIKYLKMAIKNSLTQDSRIESVENIFVQLDRDTLLITFSVIIVDAVETLSISMQL